jgi:DNA-binding transcriptional regulator YiaG
VKKGRGERPVWDARRVRALRRHLDLTQDDLARELGTRQQTISEWETGQYRPRGMSGRLLSLIAERAGFRYQVEDAAERQAKGSGE